MVSKHIGVPEKGVIKGRTYTHNCRDCGTLWKMVAFFEEDVQPSNFRADELAHRIRNSLADLNVRISESMSAIYSDLDALEKFKIDERTDGKIQSVHSKTKK